MDSGSRDFLLLSVMNNIRSSRKAVRGAALIGAALDRASLDRLPKGSPTDRLPSDQSAPGGRVTGRSAAVAVVTVLAWRARDNTDIENRKISTPTIQ